MFKFFFKKAFHWICRFFYVQLFVNLVSLPILVSWGIPISILSPIGNLIFSPLLTLFLLFSSLVFFCTLFGLPASLFVFCLENISSLWLYVMQWGNQSWLIGFIKPSYFFLVTIFLLALATIHHRKTKNIYRRIICFFLIFIFLCCYLKYRQYQQIRVETVPCNAGNVTIVHDTDHLIVIDPGVIGQRISAQSWIQYTLIPHIIKTTGKTSIDHLILLQPNKTIFEAITKLCEQFTVKKLYLVYWKGNITFPERKSFRILRDCIREKEIPFIRINQKIIKLTLPHGAITIHPQKKEIKDKQISYPAITVSGTIKEDTFEVSSYKSSKKKLQCKNNS